MRITAKKMPRGMIWIQRVTWLNAFAVGKVVAAKSPVTGLWCHGILTNVSEQAYAGHLVVDTAGTHVLVQTNGLGVIQVEC